MITFEHIKENKLTRLKTTTQKGVVTMDQSLSVPIWLTIILMAMPVHMQWKKRKQKHKTQNSNSNSNKQSKNKTTKKELANIWHFDIYFYLCTIPYYTWCRKDTKKSAEVQSHLG